MDIAESFWLLFVFLFSFVAYLSFSVISHNAVALLALPSEEKKEKFDLPPLTSLSPDLQQLSIILSFSRLIFVIPILMIAYRFTAYRNTFLLIFTLLALTILLYVLPELLLRRFPVSMFKRTVQVVSFILYPLFWLMTRFTPEATREIVVKEEKTTTDESQEVISKELKGDILKAIGEIGETTVREVMTPRVDMISVPATATLKELHAMIKEHKFSRLPVYNEKVDNVIGIASVMDLVGAIPETDTSTPVTRLMRPAMFVPETKKILSLLREFREAHAQMAIVIDEYGGTSGLVTLEDLLEELVGEIGDEHDEVPPDVYRERDGTVVVSGKFPVEKLEEMFQVEVPEEDFETISGLIFSILGRIPMTGEVVKYKNLNLEILEADKRRIYRVRIRELPREENAREIS
jgi:CBS domain containing-hemolysin-like protein